MGLYSDLLEAQKTIRQPGKKARENAPSSAARAQAAPHSANAGESAHPSVGDQLETYKSIRTRRDVSVKPQERAVPLPAAPSVRSAPPVRPVRRRTRRHAFDFYDDQIERLRGWSMQDRLQGGDGSMSRMVREAIDQFLAGEKGRRE